MNNAISQKQSAVLHNLTEGVLVTDISGSVLYANNAAYDILELPHKDISGHKFASLFFNSPANDPFSQMVLDAIYSEVKRSESIIPYHVGDRTRHLRVCVSFFPTSKDSEFSQDGYIIVITDLSELQELREIAKDTVQVNRLNKQLSLRNDLLQKTFGMFLSDEVVQQLLERPKGPQLGGVAQTLTIMMSDLRGFTALSEQMDAEDLIVMLNHYLGAMTEIIQNRGGTIIEFIGDGIMAIFGAPVSSESHAADAVAAAIEMQAAMSRVNQWNTRRSYPRLEMGIGLHTGEVIVGNVGSKKRMKYGIVGNNVNLCGRIESYTTGGQILISPDTIASISCPLTLEKEMTVSPKGVGRTLVLSQITGIGEPYNVSVKVKKDTPKSLSHPLPVCFSQIRDKHTESDYHYGGFTALGRDSAVLQTDADLKIYDNLQILAGGHLLCKVIDDMNGSWLLQFTSIPAGYSEWVKAFT